jgi:hypothetical protein
MLAQHAEPLVQPGFDGAQRTIQQIRDLLERETVIFLQDDRRALLLGQERHGFSDDAAELVPRYEIFNRLGGGALPGHFDDVDPLGGLRHRGPALTPHPVAAEVQRDAIKPGGEFRLAFEPLEGTERAQERLLRHVARVFFPADDAVRQGIDRALPAHHQLVEAVEIAPHRAGDQLFVC